MACGFVSCSRYKDCTCLCHSTDYLALVKRRVITAKQISYSAHKRHIFILFREKWVNTVVATHHGCPVWAQWYGNPQLRNAFWLVLALWIQILSPVCHFVCTAAMCGPSAEELVVYCAFSITAPIAPVTQLKVAQRVPTERSARPITCHRLSASDQANKSSQTTSELYKCFSH